jgi:hypothetical protein
LLISVVEGFSYTEPDFNPISSLYLKYFQGYKEKKYEDRPYSTNEWPSDKDHYRYLNDDIHEWLNSYNVKYRIIYRRESRQRKKYVDSQYIFWIIDIDNDEVALLFKLTWGGKIFKK